ncbi:MAG: hypothetical protein QM755_13440 [Luteolibacter sp.]
MNLFQQYRHDRVQHQTRRHFLSRCGMGLGAMWLASQGRAWGSSAGGVLVKDPANPLAPDLPHVRREGEACDLPAHGRFAEPA